MKVRHISYRMLEGNSERFNETGLGEVLVTYADGSRDSDFIRELEVFIERIHKWIPMSTAFESRRLIPDNYNIHFREPLTQEEEVRGWYD